MTKQTAREDRPNVTNAPVYALGSAVICLAAGVVVVLSGNGGKNGGALLIGLVVSTIPSLIAAAFSERVARDVRNGTVTEKARKGAHMALAEAGVVTREGPVARAALEANAAHTAALLALLAETRGEVSHNTDVTEAVAEALDVHPPERNGNHESP